MKKKLVYVAHPYGGKESNRKKIDMIMGDLVLMIRVMTIFPRFITLGMYI